MKDIRNLSDYEQIEWQRQVIREEIEEESNERRINRTYTIKR